MNNLRVWDPFMRVFHWSLVVAFAANALVIDDESKLHQWVGWFVVALVLARLVWGVIGSRHARFSDFPPSARGAVRQMSDIASGRRRAHVGHSPLGALMIYNLLFTLLVIGFSGWLMTTNAYWGVEWPEELHEVAVAWAEFSALLHIAAVAFESWRTHVNLPRAMVTGVKRIPDDVISK